VRVALIYNPTVSAVLGSSEYHTFKENASYVVKNDPDAYFYFCLPERSRVSGLPEIPRTEHVFYNDENQMWYDAQGAVPSSFIALFHGRTGKYPVDAIWTSRTTACATLGRQIQDFRAGNEQIPVFIEEFKTIGYEDMAEQRCDQEDFIGNTLAYCMGYTFFDSPYDTWVAENAAQHWLSGKGMEEFYKRSQKFYSGIDFPLLDRLTKDVKKRERFTIMVAGRLNGKKRPDFIFETLDLFYKLGNDVDIVVCTPTEPTSMGNLAEQHLKDTYPEIEIHYACKKHDYLRIAASCHAFMNASKSEGCGVGYQELIALGQVPLFPKLPWVRNLLFEYFDDFPLLYEGGSDAAVSKLNWIVNNYKACLELIEPIKEMFREKLDRERCIMQRWHFMKNMVETRSNKATLRMMSRGMEEVCRQAVNTLPKRFSLETMIRAACEASDILTEKAFEKPVRGRPSKYLLWKWLRENGYRDTVDSPAPWFERKF